MDTHTHTHSFKRERKRDTDPDRLWEGERERGTGCFLQLIFQLLPTLVLYTLTLIDFPLSS